MPEVDATAAAATPAGPRSRADEVHAQLKADIGAFRLVPGDRFSENEICARLGVSRTPVRQALARLAQEGWVEVQFRSGWRVRPFDFVRFEHLYDLREVLECAAVSRLCADHSPAAQGVLQALEARWCVAPAQRCGDGQQVAQWDEDFHAALVASTGNTEMVRVHRELTERIRIVRRLDFTQADRIAATYAEHGALLATIRRGSAAEALALLSAHIGASQSEVRRITLHQLQMARRDAKA